MRVEFRHEMNERQNLGVGDRDLQDRAYDRTTTENTLRFSLNGLLFCRRSANELKVQYSRDCHRAELAVGRSGHRRHRQLLERRRRPAEQSTRTPARDRGQHRLPDRQEAPDARRRPAGGHVVPQRRAAQRQRHVDLRRPRPVPSSAWRPPTRSASGRRWSTTASIRRAGTSRTTTRRSRSCRSASGCGTRCSRISTTSGTSRRAWASPGRPASTPCAAATASSTTGTSRASTSRRCGSTASRSRTWWCRTRSTPTRPAAPSRNPLPPSKYQAALGLQMPYLHQASIGVERTLIETLRLMASYTMMRGRDQFRAVNVNAPIHRRPRSGPARSDAGQRQPARVHGPDRGRPADDQRQLRQARAAVLHGRATTSWRDRTTSATAPSRCRPTTTTWRPSGGRRCRTCGTGSSAW